MRALAITVLLATSVSCRKSGDPCTSTPAGLIGVGAQPCSLGYSCRYDSACDVSECFGSCVPACRDGGCVSACSCTNSPFGRDLCLGNPDAGVRACEWSP